MPQLVCKGKRLPDEAFDLDGPVAAAYARSGGASWVKVGEEGLPVLFGLGVGQHRRYIPWDDRHQEHRAQRDCMEELMTTEMKTERYRTFAIQYFAKVSQTEAPATDDMGVLPPWPHDMGLKA